MRMANCGPLAGFYPFGLGWAGFYPLRDVGNVVAEICFLGSALPQFSLRL
jgi:hypothetical protein